MKDGITEYDPPRVNLNGRCNWHFSPNIGCPTLFHRRQWEQRGRGPMPAGEPGPIALAVMAAIRRRQNECLIVWEEVERDEMTMEPSYRVVVTEREVA